MRAGRMSQSMVGEASPGAVLVAHNIAAFAQAGQQLNREEGMSRRLSIERRSEGLIETVRFAIQQHIHKVATVRLIQAHMDLTKRTLQLIEQRF